METYTTIKCNINNDISISTISYSKGYKIFKKNK